jgi:hypothetical protein
MKNSFPSTSNHSSSPPIGSTKWMVMFVLRRREWIAPSGDRNGMTRIYVDIDTSSISHGHIRYLRCSFARREQQCEQRVVIGICKTSVTLLCFRVPTRSPHCSAAAWKV